jgi:hypothetical protein
VNHPPASEPLDAAAPQAGLIGAVFRHARLITVVSAIWLAVVIAGGIFTSTLEARHGLHVFGPPTWVAGQPSVLRVGLRDLTFSRFARLDAVAVHFVDASGARTPAAQIDTQAGDFVQGAVAAPRTPGAYTVALTAHATRGIATTEFPITVQPANTPPVDLPKAKTHLPPQPDQGPLKLDVFPIDQVLPGDLPTRVAVRATDATGRPQSIPVGIHVREGRFAQQMPSAVTTDRHGLATFAAQASHPSFWIDLSAADTKAARRIRRTPTQLVLDTPVAQVQPQTEIPFEVQSLHRAGLVFVDLWQDDRWLATTTVTLEGGRAQGTMPLPTLTADPAIVWLQAYRTAYLPQKARGARHLVVSAQTATQANRYVARQLAELGVDVAWAGHLALHADADPSLTRVLLGRFARPERDPALVGNSSDSARLTVTSMKSTWQKRFAWALLISGALMLGVVALMLRQNNRDVQAAWAESGGEDLVGTRKGLGFDAAYVFGVLILFLLALMTLLLQIRW